MTTQQLVFYSYDRCSTCRNAEKALQQSGVPYEKRPLVEATPSAETFLRWMQANDVPLKRWINTSGQSYRALREERGKEAVDALTREELAALLAKEGMLVKRPLLVDGDRVVIGFDREAYAALERSSHGAKRSVRPRPSGPPPTP